MQKYLYILSILNQCSTYAVCLETKVSIFLAVIQILSYILSWIISICKYQKSA